MYTSLQKRGMSLIETVVAIGIFSLFLSVATTFLLFLLHAEQTTAQDQELNFQVSTFLREFQNKISVAEHIVNPINGDTNTEVTLSYPEGSAVSEVVFYQDGTDLLLGEDGNTPVVLNSGGVRVQDITFSNRSLDSVEVLRIAVSLYTEDEIDDITTFYTSITLQQ